MSISMPIVTAAAITSLFGATLDARAQTIVAKGDTTIDRKQEPGASPFGDLIGEHTLTPTSGGESRLRFVLMRSNPSTVPSAGAGETDPPQGVKAVDRYLFEVLRSVDRDRLHDLVAIDQLVTRVSEDTRTIELEHSIEVQGPEDSLRRALSKLDAFVAANRTLITVSITAAKKATPAANDTALVSIVDQAACDAIRSAMKSASHEVLSAPTLTVYGGQRGEISALNDTPYIADFTVTATKDALIADPVIKVLKEGIRFSVTPIVDVDGEHLHLAIESWIGRVRRPIREFQTTLAAGAAQVTLQLPEALETRWKSDFLAMSRDDHAVHVEKIRFVEFDDEKGEIPEELELLIEVRRATPPSNDGGPFSGMVIGVDASNLRVFVTCRDSSGKTTTLRANQISIFRGNDPVGECVVLENLGGVLVCRLAKGEARAGDSAK